MNKQILFLVALLLSSWVRGQVVLPVKVVQAENFEPLRGVSVALNGHPLRLTDKNGTALISVDAGKIQLLFTAVGFIEKDTILVLAPLDTLIIRLFPKIAELAEAVVSSTRNNQRIENSPLKVEVLGSEELDEESTIKPSGIGSLLGDVSGVQIQQSSAVSGNVNVRIQGLDGRYTQILRDGMPLYEGFSGGFGVLSIPPLDLKQLELIKGSASTLYGGGAIGGLVNMISRKPAAKPEAIWSINQTSLRETNLNTFFSSKNKQIGYTFFAGYNRQVTADLNKDGFSDVPDLSGMILHPRLFFYPNKKTTVIVGYSGQFEKRNGGDMKVLAGSPDMLHQYFEKNSIRRNSFELSLLQNWSQGKKLEFKNTMSTFRRTITDHEISFTGRQLNFYTEGSLFIPHKGNSLVMGINITGDRFEKVTHNIPLNNFSNNTLGVFIQQTWSFIGKTIVEAGLRDDYHLTYGNFLLPRFALFRHINEHWATRFGLGLGYKAPNALSPQTTEFSIEKIRSLSSNIQAEKSTGWNAEINYKAKWGDGNSFFINQAFFLTRLDRPVVADVLNNGEVLFVNKIKQVTSRGIDTYIKATIEDLELYAGYTYTVVERKYLTSNQFMPLTPRNRIAFTGVWEMEDLGFRLGLEGSYTGQQHRDGAVSTPGYFFMAGMVEKKLGHHVSLVLNGENLLDYRQSKVESLFTGSISNPVFQPLWAPIDGRVINLCLRWKG